MPLLVREAEPPKAALKLALAVSMSVAPAALMMPPPLPVRRSPPCQRRMPLLVIARWEKSFTLPPERVRVWAEAMLAVLGVDEVQSPAVQVEVPVRAMVAIESEPPD